MFQPKQNSSLEKGKIELVYAVNCSKFSNFNIAVRSSTGGAWSDETLYASSTGTTTKSYLDGLTQGDVGYIHQTTSTTKDYEILVTYSHDKVDATDQLTITFQCTPLPEAHSHSTENFLFLLSGLMRSATGSHLAEIHGSRKNFASIGTQNKQHLSNQYLVFSNARILEFRIC